MEEMEKELEKEFAFLMFGNFLMGIWDPNNNSSPKESLEWP